MTAVNACYSVFREQRSEGTDVPLEHGAFAPSDTAFEEILDKRISKLLMKR